MTWRRVLVRLGEVVLLAALAACGEGVAGSQRESRQTTGSVSDQTQLAAGANEQTSQAAKTDGPALPLVRDVAVRGQMAYALVPDALVVVSLEDPASPTVLGRQVVARTPGRLVLDGVHAYVACGAGGLQVVAVGQPRETQVVGAYAPEKGTVDCVAVANGLAVVGVPGVGLIILNVSDPSQPTEQKVVPLKGAITDVMLAEGRAYVVGKDLTVVEVAKPAEAKVVGTIQVKEKLLGLGRVGDFTVLLSDAWLHLLNLRSPERPHRAAELATTALVQALGEVKPVAAAATPAEGAGADNVTMITAQEVTTGEATAATQPAAAESTPKSEPASAPTATAGAPAAVTRLVVAGDRVFLLRNQVIDVVGVVDWKSLQPVVRWPQVTQPSCLAAADSLVLVGNVAGDLAVYRFADGQATRLGAAALATEGSTSPGAAPLPPVSKGAQAAMTAAPEPSAQRPVSAPKP